jgi:amidase
MSIVDLSACELSKAIHAKKVSCVEVMQAYLNRIDSINPAYNAIVSLRSADVLLKEAQVKDALLARGNSQGWMHGFPLAPKDLTSTAGLLTTMGFLGMAKHIPAQDSVVVSRMRGSGSILIGKTNTPEFGLGSHTYNRVFGATGNAFDPTKSAGGSSGGTAVALAKNMLPVADGSDMMGSLRNPAAWNGIYGLRPSMGRIPYGTQAGSALVGDVFFQQLGTEGPMARNAEDLAQLFAIMAGKDVRAPLSHQANEDFTCDLRTNVQGRRVAWLGDMGGYLPIEPALLQGYESALKYFDEIACTAERAKLGIDLPNVWQAWLTLRGLTVTGNLSIFASHNSMRAMLKPEAIWEYEQGLRYTALDIYKASLVRSSLLAQFLSVFETADYIAMPATQCMPFDIQLDWPKSIAGRSMDTYHRWMECTIYATMAGLPAIVIPAGFIDGLPFGLQIVGKPQGEMALLQLAYAWQSRLQNAL